MDAEIPRKLSASYSLTLRVALPQRPGSFARVAGAIGDAGRHLGAIDLVRVEEREHVIRDVTVACEDAEPTARRSSPPSARSTRSRSRASPTARS